MKKLSDKEREARLEKLLEMKKELKSILPYNGDPRQMEKVTVMAKDKEGLKEGLKKAEEVVEDLPEKEMSLDEMSLDEMSADEMSSDEMSIDEIKEKIKELQKMLEMKSE